MTASPGEATVRDRDPPTVARPSRLRTVLSVLTRNRPSSKPSGAVAIAQLQARPAQARSRTTPRRLGLDGGARSWAKAQATCLPTVVDADVRSVAVGIAGAGPVGTIALEECDRRAAGAVPRDRAAEFGRMRSSAAAQLGPEPDDCCVAEAKAGSSSAPRRIRSLAGTTASPRMQTREGALGPLLDYAFTGHAGAVTAFLCDSEATRSTHEIAGFVPTRQPRPEGGRLSSSQADAGVSRRRRDDFLGEPRRRVRALLFPRAYAATWRSWSCGSGGVSGLRSS